MKTLPGVATDASAREVAATFTRRVLWRQGLVGAAAFFVVELLAPWSLTLESQRLSELWLIGLAVGAAFIAVSLASSIPAMWRARAVFRALTLQPERVDAEHIGVLSRLPFALTARFVLVGVVAALLLTVPGVRPALLDEPRAFSLALLTLTIVAAAAVVHYVAIRDATNRALELGPSEPIASWLERASMRLGPQQRVKRNLLFAVAAPVALVGVGTVLVVHAHLRAFVENSRQRVAIDLVQAALDPVPGVSDEAGRDDAIAAAAAHGFLVRYQRGERGEGAHDVPHRIATGQLALTTSIEEGTASVRYAAELPSDVVITSAWLALTAVFLAAAFGLVFGRAVAHDLALATQQVSSLGTESVLRGTARVAGPARFGVVAELGSSVEALAERFRVFAVAQERALEARAAAQRMKQLLFASVSHDLKSPLNAILGFAELVRQEPLTQAQTECLSMVSGRGRELLALIETILDAARVEAGQLTLAPQSVLADDVLHDALVIARELRSGRRVDSVVELSPDLPPIRVDPPYAARALAVLLAQAMDSAEDASSHAVRLRGELVAGGAGETAVGVSIEYPAAADRPSLLEAQLSGLSPTSAGRSRVLRLGLARALIEMHGGRVHASRSTRGTAVVTCTFPVITV
jgi:signal transduction histidine kinase